MLVSRNSRCENIIDLEFGSTLDICITKMDQQKFPPCGSFLNYNVLSLVCQCTFYGQNCEPKYSEIVGDAIYVVESKSNQLLFFLITGYSPLHGHAVFGWT